MINHSLYANNHSLYAITVLIERFIIHHMLLRIDFGVFLYIIPECV